MQYTTCNQTDSDGDGLTNNYELNFALTDVTVADTDGDTFSDAEEVLPILVPGCAGGGYQITLHNVEPLVRDVFVEIDWMQVPGDHTHLPDTQVLLDIVSRFSVHGINLHLDTGAVPFDLGGGNEIPHSENGSAGTFNSHRDSYFNADRCAVFRYCISYHGTGFGQTMACDDPSRPAGTLFLDGFLITSNPSQSSLRIGKVFMHELGHSLQLYHGGNENVFSKPNYRSVMQSAGLGIKDCNGVETSNLDYSDEQLGPINEADLREEVGSCFVDTGAGPQCVDHSIPIGCIGRDWDRSGNIDTYNPLIPKVFDVNGDGVIGVLTGFNDWENIQLLPMPIANECPLGGGGLEWVTCCEEVP